MLWTGLHGYFFFLGFRLRSGACGPKLKKDLSHVLVYCIVQALGTAMWLASVGTLR